VVGKGDFDLMMERTISYFLDVTIGNLLLIMVVATLVIQQLGVIITFTLSMIQAVDLVVMLPMLEM